MLGIWGKELNGPFPWDQNPIKLSQRCSSHQLQTKVTAAPTSYPQDRSIIGWHSSVSSAGQTPSREWERFDKATHENRVGRPWGVGRAGRHSGWGWPLLRVGSTCPAAQLVCSWARADTGTPDSFAHNSPRHRNPCAHDTCLRSRFNQCHCSPAGTAAPHCDMRQCHPHASCPPAVPEAMGLREQPAASTSSANS